MVELLRTCRRLDRARVNDAQRLLDGLDLVPMDRVIGEQAASLMPKELRGLDAIHRASALDLGDRLADFVVYDIRLRAAAALFNLPIRSPAPP
jgi:hypothetical protein